MGDAAELAAKLRNLSDRGLGPVGRQVVVKKAALAARPIIEDVARKDLGGDLRFSGWKRAGNLGVKWKDPESDGSIVLLAKPPGPWKVLERGRRAGSKTRVRGKNKGRTFHWGSTFGKGTWTFATGELDRDLPSKVMDKAAKDLFESYLR